MDTDPDSLTPRAALELLYELRREAERMQPQAMAGHGQSSPETDSF
jgi:hypothetical protein